MERKKPNSDTSDIGQIDLVTLGEVSQKQLIEAMKKAGKTQDEIALARRELEIFNKTNLDIASNTQ